MSDIFKMCVSEFIICHCVTERSQAECNSQNDNSYISFLDNENRV